MQLNEWMIKTGTSAKQLQEKLGLPFDNTVYRYRRGERTPSPAMMNKIAEVTGGDVTPNDFVLQQPSGGS